jgi:hypothetical protein
MRHTIRINQTSSGKYCVIGSANITSTTAPIIEAARELLARGASPDDEIVVDCGEVSVLPASIGSILRPRITSHRNDLMREMIGLDRRR